MQIPDTDQECLCLFDPNTYQEGQGPRLGNCYQPPTYDELMAASTENGLKLLPNNREKFFEFILKEQQVRLNQKVQQLYKDMNHSSAVEHAIHSELFKSFGYDDCPLNHKLYFALTRKYSNDPELKPQVFFWRNNVMHGSRVKLHQIPPPIPLLTLENKELQLEQLLQSAHEEQKLCVIFAGNSMPDYIEFAQKYKDTCKCQYIYIKEAHFLETDEKGKFVDGWPRGYFGFEYPQHKSQEQRFQMAQILKTKYNIPDEFPIYQDIYPQNLFDESFGIWPDNLCVFKDSKLIYRGIINLDGTRNASYSKELEEQLDNFKY